MCSNEINCIARETDSEVYTEIKAMEIVKKLKTDNSILRIKLTWNPNDFHLMLVTDSEAFERLVFTTKKLYTLKVTFMHF